MAKKKAAKSKRANSKKADSKSTRRKTTRKEETTKSSGTKRRATAIDEPTEFRQWGFPLVCLGASAGGLDALQDFFDHMPADGGMAFLVVTHQHPGHTSLLSQLLARHTKMPVVEASDGAQIEPNHVYVSSPGAKLGVLGGAIVVMPTDDSSEGHRAEIHLPIDDCLRSVAEDFRERAIGIILSGTGSDGTIGLRAIKSTGGAAIVQQPESAKFDGMPRSAIGTGVVDFVLTPREMPGELASLASACLASDSLSIPDEPLRKILLLLKTRTGNDFLSYKSTTIRRRIERRMNIHKIRGPNAYVKYLQEHPHETELLFKELLISVTNFFRDADAFAALADGPLDELIDSRPDGHTFRAWVPGCATGEEAYSLAILLREAAERHEKNLEFQVFATDLDAKAIEVARTGVYPAGIAHDVSDERLKRFFHREELTWQVRKEIREMVVFAPQNLIKDSAFTRLDLLCCRNLLIYLEAELQQRLLPIFHYALKPGGLLLLGPSETIGTGSELFEPLDKRWKIYRRTETAVSGLPDMPAKPASPSEGDVAGGAIASVALGAAVSSVTHEPHLARQIERMLLNQFAPAGVVVTERGEIVYVHGRTGLYLEPATGQARMNVLDMAREGLHLELATCFHQAKTSKAKASCEGVRVKTNGDYAYANVSVQQIDDPPSVSGLYLITLQPAAPPPDDEGAPTALAAGSADAGSGDTDAGVPGIECTEPPDDDGKQLGACSARSQPRKPKRKSKDDRVRRLERELQFTKESLQSTIEELETANEELKSSNEELQSTNEEQQSTNEELETAQEEMQSLNEEMNTVNTELQAKLDELSYANDDMQNLLNSTEIATVFLDNELRVRRFTPSVRKLIKLIDSDVGRLLSDLKWNLDYDALEDDAREVLQTLVFREAEVRTDDGQRYQMRIFPYRTARNVIDGLVLTFVNIQVQLEASEQRQAAVRSIFENIVQTVLQPMLVLDDELRVIICNRSFYDLFEMSEQDVEQKHLFEISDGAWDVPQLRELLEKLLPQETIIENFEFTHDFAGVGRKHLLLNARRLVDDPELPVAILLAVEDVTNRR